MARVDGSYPSLRRDHERAVQNELERFFDRQRDDVASRIAAGVAVNLAAWDGRLTDVLFDRSKDAAADYAVRVAAALDPRARIDPDLLDAWIDEYAANAASDINQSTQDAVDAADEPLTVFAALPAATYATGLVTSTSNFGAQDGAKAGGATSKGWMTTSAKPRPDHAAMSGASVPMDSRFSNGMRWPGDPAGGAEQVANCKCALFFTT